MNELIKLIEAFERRCGFKVSFHDYTGKLWSYLQMKRQRHDNGYCDCIKEKYGLEKCLYFEKRRVPLALAGYAEGCFKICHGGIIEYAAPLMKDGNILGTMFIGFFRLKDISSIPDVIVCGCESCDFAPELNNKFYKEVPCIDKDDFKDIAEIAKALKYRIEALFAKEEKIFFSHENKIKWEIEKYIGQNCQKDINIQHLAKHLYLSVSRTGQLVRKLFNMTYPELLNRSRIDNAKILLSSTSLSISETAYRCGFADAAYFYRIFKKIEKITPGEYKEKNNRIKDMLT